MVDQQRIVSDEIIQRRDFLVRKLLGQHCLYSWQSIEISKYKLAQWSEAESGSVFPHLTNQNMKVRRVLRNLWEKVMLWV